MQEGVGGGGSGGRLDIYIQDKSIVLEYQYE